MSTNISFFLCFLLITVFKGEIVLTQSLASIAASQEEVTVTCRASSSIVSSHLHWYQQKSGGSPTLIVYGTSKLASGVPAGFCGSGSGISYCLAISNFEAEDVATFFSQQRHSSPPT